VPARHAPLQLGLGTVGACIGADRLSLGGVCAHRLARIHMGMGSSDLGRVKGRDWAAYEMPSLAGKKH